MAECSFTIIITRVDNQTLAINDIETKTDRQKDLVHKPLAPTQESLHHYIIDTEVFLKQQRGVSKESIFL